MSDQDLQKAIEFAAAILRETQATEYVHNAFKPHLTALLIQQENRAKAKQ
jgi:hypothetical protein